MVAAAALGDVVEQHRDIEHAARRDLAEQSGRQRMVARPARRARSPRAARSRGSNARRPYNGGTCRTASARRRGRSRERSGRTRRPRSSSAAPRRARCWSVSTSRKKALAAGIVAHLRRPAARRAPRRASPWGGFPARRARRARTARPAAPGSSANQSSRGIVSRPRSSAKPSSRPGRRRIVGKREAAALLGQSARRAGRGTARSGRRPSSR